MGDLPIVDAHQHFWDLELNYLPWLCDEKAIPFRYGDYRALRRNYLPRDYLRDAAGHHVVRTVYVETEWDPRDFVGETRWLQEIIAASGFPHAIVAGARLDNPDVEAVLAGHAAFPEVRGIRHKPRAAPSPADVRPGAPGSMGDPAWRRGYALLEKYRLSFDLQVYWHQMADAADLARACPGVPMMLNHAGLPHRRDAGYVASWRSGMRTLAKMPNVAAKISGLGMFDHDWTVESLRPLVLDTIEIFGPGRCMFASNFPVDRLSSDYDAIWEAFDRITADFSETERRALFHDNAVRLYRL